MRTQTGKLDAIPPFDARHAFAFAASFAPATGEQVLADDGLTKAFMIAGSPTLIRVAAAPSGVSYVARGDAPKASIETRLRMWLSLDDDLRPFVAAAKKDAAFAPVERALHGFHQIKFPTPFENAVWAILGQRTPFPISRSMKQKLVQALGERVEAPDGTPLWGFPEARVVRDAGEPALRAFLGHEKKARYVHAAASAFADIDESWLTNAPVDKVREWLLAIDGIGPWSSGFVLIRGLGRMDAPLSFEPELLRAAGRVYAPGKEATRAQVDAWSEPYGDLKGYWALYLRAHRDAND